jgi:hypothetical protein
MAYEHKNGMRYRAADKITPNVGYHFHSDISARVGTGSVRTIWLHVTDRLSAGSYIPLKVKLKTLHFVKLNNYKLTHKIDYILKDNSEVAFTFNLTTNDKVEIEGYVDAI